MRRTPAGMEIDEMKRIVVDSSASLYQLDGIDFAAVPLKIVTDEREYLDDGTLDAVEMATTLRTYKGKTSTSCPNIGDWLEAYEGADEIYAITITGTLSGSCNAAQLAAEEYQAEHPVLRSLCWTACLPARSWCCWPSISVRSSKRAGSLTMSAKRCCATVTTPICCSRWNRWRIWPGMAA